MTSYTDLDPLPYFGEELAEHLRAVGWLERGSVFETGVVSPDLVAAIRKLLVATFQPIACGGVFECDLCQFDGPMGGRNLWIPGDGFLYVMPELVLHYMGAHHYLPPAEFQQAILDCPEMQSMSYKKAFLNNGGREVLKKLEARPKTWPPG